LTSDFYRDVYRLVRAVPRGRVTTYGSIARALGKPHGARQVGWALYALNGQHLRVPAHRVVNAQGALSGSWAFGDPGVQRARLERDGVVFDADGRVSLERYLWTDWR
jgi:methylated-DNA-protein-cysteine methyltransferase related protein